MEYLIAELCFLIPYWLLLKLFYLPIEDSMSTKENGYLAALSLLLCILLLLNTFIAPSEVFRSSPSTSYLFFILLIAIFIVYMLFFKILGLFHEKIQSQQESLQLQHQNELSIEQYRRIHEQIVSGRRMRHDLIHHLRHIYGLLTEGNPEEARKYLGQYPESEGTNTTAYFCNNAPINILTGYYYSMAKNQGIDFSSRITIPAGKLSIQDVDLSVLLGNLLDNAIYAAKLAHEGNRFIRLNIIYSGKMLAITVDNGFDGNIKKSGETYLSTKQKHQGIGLKSILRISKKYHGGVEFTHEKLIFHASVMLMLEEGFEKEPKPLN